MTDLTSCSSIQNMFSSYLENELDAAATARLKEHLAICPTCHNEWQLFEESLRWLKALQPEPVPAGFLPGIHDKLSRSRSPMAWLRGLFTPPTLAISSLTALGALLLFLAMPHNPTTPVRGTSGDLASTRPTGSTPRFPTPEVRLQTLPVMNYAAQFAAHRPGQTITTLVSTPMPRTAAESLAVRPDLSITVHTTSEESQALLYDRLLTQNRWRVAPAPRSGMILVFLDASELPTLRHALAPHQVTLTTPAGLPQVTAPQGLLTVALHLQAE